MAAIKPSVPKGTRDFSPAEMVKRNFIFDTIKGVFRKYGYQQIETPSMENLSTLTGKYGDEGDKLMFKILNSGDYLSKVNPEKFTTHNSQLITQEISEKALRYDLTVPFARYVVQCIKTKSHSRLNVSRCSRYGVQTDRRRVAIANFFNAMLTLLDLIHY
jgi:histidyl-tRNA synthetase